MSFYKMNPLISQKTNNRRGDKFCHFFQTTQNQQFRVFSLILQKTKQVNRPAASCLVTSFGQVCAAEAPGIPKSVGGVPAVQGQNQWPFGYEPTGAEMARAGVRALPQAEDQSLENARPQ